MTELIAVSLSALHIDAEHRDDVLLKLMNAATPLVEAGYDVTIEVGAMYQHEGRQLHELSLVCTPDDVNAVRAVQRRLTTTSANLAVLGHTTQIELMPFTNGQLAAALTDEDGIVDSEVVDEGDQPEPEGTDSQPEPGARMKWVDDVLSAEPAEDGPTPAGDQSHIAYKLAEALRLTAEYVGQGMLPAVDGWSWFDALKEYSPSMAQAFVDRGAEGTEGELDLIARRIGEQAAERFAEVFNMLVGGVKPIPKTVGDVIRAAEAESGIGAPSVDLTTEPDGIYTAKRWLQGDPPLVKMTGPEPVKGWETGGEAQPAEDGSVPASEMRKQAAERRIANLRELTVHEREEQTCGLCGHPLAEYRIECRMHAVRRVIKGMMP